MGFYILNCSSRSQMREGATIMSKVVIKTPSTKKNICGGGMSG
jgi:hypothetical protein